jgi:hypothetical protein
MVGAARPEGKRRPGGNPGGCSRVIETMSTGEEDGGQVPVWLR